MKKLLSILAAVGLTATASTAAVSCSSSSKKSDEAKVEGQYAVETVSINVPKGIKFAQDTDDYKWTVQAPADLAGNSPFEWTTEGSTTEGNEYTVLNLDKTEVSKHTDGGNNIMGDFDTLTGLVFKVGAYDLAKGDKGDLDNDGVLKADKTLNVEVCVPLAANKMLKGISYTKDLTIVKYTWDATAKTSSLTVIAAMSINVPGTAVPATN